MKALILSGGKGSRLRPITHTQAKQLVPIANKPILFYGLEAVAACGIREVGIVVGDTRSEIRAAVGSGQNWNLKVSYIEQEAPLGLAHAVKISEKFLGREPFVMYLGDNLLCHGIQDIVQSFEREKPNAQILLAKVKNPQQFGVAELSGGRVVRLEEKPKKPKSDLALVGVYLFDSHIFEAVNAIAPSARGELEITDAIQYLITKKHKVTSHLVDGWWKDTGKLADLLEANRLVLESLESSNAGKVGVDSRIEGRVVIESGARIIHSVVRGPAIIGKNAVIENAYVGPFTSIYHDAILRNCEVEHSIILEHAIVEDIRRLEDSLIGESAVVRRSSQVPRAYRVVVGDSSSVEVA